MEKRITKKYIRFIITEVINLSRFMMATIKVKVVRAVSLTRHKCAQPETHELCRGGSPCWK